MNKLKILTMERPAVWNRHDHVPSPHGKNTLVKSRIVSAIIAIVELLWLFVTTITCMTFKPVPDPSNNSGSLLGDALEMHEKTPFDFFLDLGHKKKFRLLHKVVHNVTDTKECHTILRDPSRYKKGIAWTPVSYLLGQGLFTDIDSVKRMHQRGQLIHMFKVDNSVSIEYLVDKYIDDLLHSGVDTKQTILKCVEHIMIGLFLRSDVDMERLAVVTETIPRILTFLNNKSFGGAILPLNVLRFMNKESRDYYADVMVVKEFAQTLGDDVDVDTVMSILFAASTLSNLISWMILELSVDPQLQRSIRDEYPSTRLQDKTIREVWRLYPPLWAHPRQGPNGELYFVNIFARNRTEEYAGKNPNAFSVHRPKYRSTPSFMFGTKSYSCMGATISNTILRIFTTELLSRGIICTDAEHPVQMISEAALTPRYPFRTYIKADQ